jgi:hypothetical protein
MKSYVGEHFGLDGTFVESGGKRKLLEPRFEVVCRWKEGFAWGRLIDPATVNLPVPLSARPIHPGAAQLAFAILADFYDVNVARKAYMRFAYRTTITGMAGQPYILLDAEITMVMAAIKAVEEDEAMRLMKARAERERPVPVTEGGPEIVWDAYEEPKVNLPER